MKTFFAALLFVSQMAANAADTSSIQEMLQRRIIGPEVGLAEVQAYTEARVTTVPEAATAGEWDKIAGQLRRDALDRVVFRGEAAQWRRMKTQVVWLETMPGGPGYRIRKLRYQALPGLWIPALLYEPENMSGKVPVALSVNGHEGIGKSVPYKQIRCINLAKRGILVLNPEWIGMGQLGSTHYQHSLMNQLDLCGTSGVSTFYLAMSRGLDVLLEHSNADAKRVIVSGLSGGGWQTIFISALDERVTLSNPVAGYSSFKTRARFLSDLGDSEQTPCDLATVVDYAHLTAMRAPRPTLLTFNAKDNCCFASAHALNPLLEAARPKFALYGRENNLRSHVNVEPGDHNFGVENREAFYRMVGDSFFPGGGFDAKEIPCESEVKSNATLHVELPADNATFNSLARALSKDLPRDASFPNNKAAAETWQRQSRGRLRDIVKAKEYQVVAERVDAAEADGQKVVFWKVRLGNDWTVPVVEFAGTDSTPTTLVVADGGKASCSAEVAKLLGEGQRVLVADPFYFGESKIQSHDYLFALLVAAVGERPLGIQASEIAAIARWSNAGGAAQGVHLLAIGPRSSTFALVAAALEERSIASVELRQPLGSLKQVIENNWGVNQFPELFCFGLLEAFDVQQIAALTAPRDLTLLQLDDRATREFEEVKSWFQLLGGNLHLAASE